MDSINKANYFNKGLIHNSKDELRDKTKSSLASSSFNALKEPLATKKISPINATNDKFNGTSAAKIGRKGMFLGVMQNYGLQVPQFSCVSVDILQELENLPIPATLINQYIPGIKFDNATVTISELKNIIYKANKENQPELLNKFDKLLTSNQLHKLFKDTGINQQLQKIYNSVKSDSKQAIIVRSSGINEDDFGDAQAGKYNSKVHCSGDVITTVLELIAANFRSDIANNNEPALVSMVLQQVIKSKTGGVIMSYTSINDNSIHLEFAPGQPKGAVCGQTGIIPHRCVINRSGESLEANYTRGNITKQFILEQQGDAFLEIERPYAENHSDHLLSKELLSEITTAVQTLESLLSCPVDVEIAIDENDNLYILQVRPITKLSGSLNFNIVFPNNQICGGDLISEGLATGSAFVVNSDQDLAKVPHGAIVIADHATDAMLEYKFLNKVSGFIFKNCGSNDHVAITLRQADKPCLLALASNFTTLTDYHNQQVTLVAGAFNEKLSAYLLEGNQFEVLSKQSVTANSVDAVLNYRQQELRPVPQFDSVDIGFQLLHQQNSKLLNFYQMQGVFDQCLSAKNLLLISISPHRDEIIQNLIAEIKLFNHELEVLLDILEKYINLGITATTPKDIKDKLTAYNQEITLLRNKLSTIQTQIGFLVEIVNIFHASDNDTQLGNFDKWLQDCNLLSDKLQKLNIPHSANQVDSLHDLIFWVHKMFVSATNYVAIGSKQGDISEEAGIRDGSITWINLSKNSIFNENSKIVMRSFMNRSTVIIMQDIAIVNSKLGMNHFCTIEMLENAEGGKGRTIRLNFADEFSASKHKNGKFNRIIILNILLNKYINTEEFGNLNIKVLENAGSVLFEYTHINSKDNLELAFKKIVDILATMFNLDLKLDRFTFDANMDFKKLENILITNDQERNEMFFYRFLIACATSNILDEIDLLKDEEKQILEIYKSLYSDYKKIRELAKKNNPTELEQKAKFHFLFGQPHMLFTSWNNDSQKINSKLIEQELSVRGVSLEYMPKYVKEDKYYVSVAVESDNEALEFVDESILDDEDFMFSLIKKNHENLDFASERLKNKPEFVLPALQQNGFILKYLSDNIKDNKECFLTAINAPFENLDFRKKEKSAYEFGSERLKNDPDIKKMVMFPNR